MFHVRNFEFLLLSGSAFTLSTPAWAQDTVSPALCVAGEPCADAIRWGGWGLSLIGLALIAVWVMPPPRRREDAVGNAGVSLMRMLQGRIENEMTGWRRWQWPVLGAFFLGLGIATLAGWR